MSSFSFSVFGLFWSLLVWSELSYGFDLGFTFLSSLFLTARSLAPRLSSIYRTLSYSILFCSLLLFSLRFYSTLLFSSPLFLVLYIEDPIRHIQRVYRIDTVHVWHPYSFLVQFRAISVLCSEGEKERERERDIREHIRNAIDMPNESG